MDPLALIEKLLHKTTSGEPSERSAAASLAFQHIARHKPVFLVEAGTLVRIAAPPDKAIARTVKVQLRLHTKFLRTDSPLAEGVLAFDITGVVLFVRANHVTLAPTMLG